MSLYTNARKGYKFQNCWTQTPNSKQVPWRCNLLIASKRLAKCSPAVYWENRQVVKAQQDKVYPSAQSLEKKGRAGLIHWDRWTRDGYVWLYSLKDKVGMDLLVCSGACMPVCVCLCMKVYVCVCEHVCVSAGRCMSVCASANMQIHDRVYVHAHKSVCISVCDCKQLGICINKQMAGHMYTLWALATEKMSAVIHTYPIHWGTMNSFHCDKGRCLQCEH